MNFTLYTMYIFRPLSCYQCILNFLSSVSPLFASTDLLENAPETFIYASELDIFSNDAVMLNKRLVDVGVKSQLEMVKMSMHNEHFLSKYFWGFNTYMPSADKHVEAYFTHLKNIL